MCDRGAAEFYPNLNALVKISGQVKTSFDATSAERAPAGRFFVGATFTNTSTNPIRVPFFEVNTLSGDNVLLNAERGPGGVGARLRASTGDEFLMPGESTAVEFEIGLQKAETFQFLVDFYG